METEPSGTHELYLRKSGFQHTDVSRLECSTPVRGVILGILGKFFSKEITQRMGATFAPFFKFEKIRCPEVRTSLPKESSQRRSATFGPTPSTLRDLRVRECAIR